MEIFPEVDPQSMEKTFGKYWLLALGNEISAVQLGSSCALDRPLGTILGDLLVPPVPRKFDCITPISLTRGLTVALVL
jgi:hypothetical protein